MAGFGDADAIRTEPATSILRTLRSRSEPGTDVELQDVEAIAGAVDLVAAPIPQPRPDVARQAQFSPEEVTLGIGAADVEIGVGPCIDHRIRLHVAVADGRAPLGEAVDGGIAVDALAQMT